MDTSDFLCPISREIMQDPVIAADGHTYEREMISGASSLNLLVLAACRLMFACC